MEDISNFYIHFEDMGEDTFNKVLNDFIKRRNLKYTIYGNANEPYNGISLIRISKPSKDADIDLMKMYWDFMFLKQEVQTVWSGYIDTYSEQALIHEASKLQNPDFTCLVRNILKMKYYDVYGKIKEQYKNYLSCMQIYLDIIMNHKCRHSCHD